MTHYTPIMNPSQYPQPLPPPPAAGPYGYGYPAPVPQPARSNKAVVIVLAAVGVLVAAVVVGVIVFKAKMGTAYKVTDKETVRYSGDATEADAQKLGDELKSMGYFQNNTEKDVLIRKDATGTTISFVVNDNWNQPHILASFKLMAAELGKSFGKPLKVRLIDESLKELKEVTVP